VRPVRISPVEVTRPWHPTGEGSLDNAALA
jgi:hypothetical protein